MEIDPETGIVMSKLENAAIGRAQPEAPWPYAQRVALFGIIRSQKAELDDPTSIPLDSARQARLLHDQQTFGPVLEAMLSELAPHIEDTGIAEGAEAFLSERFD